MGKKINCFIPFESVEQAQTTVNGLKENSLVKEIYLLATSDNKESIDGCKTIVVDNIKSTNCMKKIADNADAEYLLFYTKYNKLPQVLKILKLTNLPFLNMATNTV